MTNAPRLPRSAPEDQGVDSAALTALFRAIDRDVAHAHNIIVMRHGHVVAEGTWAPYRPEDPHMFFSLSKSFTSTAIGLAIDEGRLTAHDRVLPFFEGDAPAEISANLAAMRVHDLLSMTSGHGEDTMMSMFSQPDGNWARGFLGQPVTHQPGTHFVYNSGATYMLSAILQRVTGQTLLEYLGPRLYAPLGIASPAWESCPRGVNTGGWGMSAAIEDIACFGQLYLQRGSWGGRQIIPAGWVDEATRRHISNGSAPESDWEQGYGYQFWRCRHGAYRGDGAFGQYCVVLPEQGVVFAMTSGVSDMQSVLNILWRELLPGLRAGALPAAPEAQRALAQTLGALSLPTPAGSGAPARAAQISGRRFAIAPNELGVTAATFTFGTFGGEGATITLEDAQGAHALAVGDRAWLAGSTTLDARAPRLSPPDRGRAPVPVAAAGAWGDAGSYTAQLWYTTTPFGMNLACTFSDDQLTIVPRLHVSFMPTDLPTLTGHLAG